MDKAIKTDKEQSKKTNKPKKDYSVPSQSKFGPITNEDIDQWIKEGKLPKKFQCRTKNKLYGGDKSFNDFYAKYPNPENQKVFFEDPSNNNDPLKKQLLKEMKKEAEFTKFLLDNKDKILDIYSKADGKVFRQAKELIDNKLDREIEINDQLTFFDSYDNEQEKKVCEAITPMIKGLSLTPKEDRLLHVINLLLHQKSEVHNQESEDYYMGNHQKGIVTIDDVNHETARIMITPHELFVSYYDSTQYSSKNAKDVLSTLNALSQKVFLVTFNFQKPGKKKGQVLIDKVRINMPIYQLAYLNTDLTESESRDIDNSKHTKEGKNSYILLKLQPIFTHNIRKRYVEFPQDIHTRISKASRGKATECTNQLRDLLFREKQAARLDANRFIMTRNESTLFRVLRLDKLIAKGSRKKRAEQTLQKSFDIFTNLGLILKTETTTGKLGQKQYVIHINPEFK